MRPPEKLLQLGHWIQGSYEFLYFRRSYLDAKGPPPATPQPTPSPPILPAPSPQGPASSPLPAPGPAHRARAAGTGTAPPPAVFAGRRLPALRRRGPRLPCRLRHSLRLATLRLRHRPPTHGAAAGGGGAAGLRPPPSDPSPPVAGRASAWAAAVSSAAPLARQLATVPRRFRIPPPALTSHPRRGGPRRTGGAATPSLRMRLRGVSGGRREARPRETLLRVLRPCALAPRPGNSPESVFQVADGLGVVSRGVRAKLWTSGGMRPP